MTAPPRLVVRTMAVTFVTVAVILSVVFVVLTVDARDRVRAAETAKLRVSEAVFSAQEGRRQSERLAMMRALAEQPRVKAALDTYFSELTFGGVTPDGEAALRLTVTQEIDNIAGAVEADAVALLDVEGRVFTASGPAKDAWRIGERVAIPGLEQPAFLDVAVMPGGQAFRVTGASLRVAGDREVGAMILAQSLDDKYARELSKVAGAGIVIVLRDRVVASTVSDAVTRDLMKAASTSAPPYILDGEEYAVGPLFASGVARIYSLSSIDAAAAAATREALIAHASIAGGGFVLALLGSVWLARTLTNPIDRLSGEIATTTAARAFGRPLQPTGTSRELDSLATAFNDLMRSLMEAEAETRATYLGAIRGLAAALDARDPYTAGHSERVSALSVLIARQMNLPEHDVDVIRLGALLHDIGKIGVRDNVLRKAGPLTQDEFEQIQRHPALGARILRQVPFLAPHIPIVELHHERPDGRGYPLGLSGDDIPLAARIVHVADAYDAMTSARAYRPARSPAVALDELQRCSGVDFDRASVEALCSALPYSTSATEPQLEEMLGRGA
jgi:putative nucleotidyltransferase with HDIG domain